MKAALWKGLKWAVRHSPERLRLAFLEEPLIIPTDMDGIRIVAHSREEYYMRAKSKAKEPETVAWIDSLGDGSFIDIGANVGTYAIHAARRQVPTLAIEPHPPSYASLCCNAEINGVCDWLTPICVSCWQNTCVWHTRWSSWHPGSALHQSMCKSTIWHTQPGLYASLDSILRTIHWSGPYHMKIDVDGDEYEVLRGARETLKHTTTMIIEIDERNIARCGQLLSDVGLGVAKRWPTDIPTMSNYLFERS